MPHGMSGDNFDELVARVEDVFGDLIDYGMIDAESMVADAADAISAADDDAFDVLSNLIDEREEAAALYEAGFDVDWDISEYLDYNLDDEWLMYH